MKDESKEYPPATAGGTDSLTCHCSIPATRYGGGADSRAMGSVPPAVAGGLIEAAHRVT